MKKNFAPIDGKNVGTDWIDDIFDYSMCTETCKHSLTKVCGFVNGELVECTYNLGNNVICWYIYASYAVLNDTKDELLKRLSKYEHDDNDLYSEMEILETSVIQRFYWKED